MRYFVLLNSDGQYWRAPEWTYAPALADVFEGPDVDAPVLPVPGIVAGVPMPVIAVPCARLGIG